jgi:hypothetical protein
MDIKDLKQEMATVELELAITIGHILNAFHAKTGVSIENVSVDMARINTTGETVSEHVVRSVHCDIDLGLL